MTRLRAYILTTLLLHTVAAAIAQNTPPVLLVLNEQKLDLSALLKQINLSKTDTNRINMLVRAASYYWHKRSDEVKLDSCRLLAAEAYDQSRSLSYTAGKNEAGYVLCKVYTQKGDFTAANKLVKEAWGEQSVRLMIAIGEAFVFRYEPGSPEFSRTPQLLQEAMLICQQAGSERWMEQCLLLQSKYFFKNGELLAGKNALLKIINKHHEAQNYKQEAKYWSALGNNMPENDSTFEDILRSHEMAVHYYFKANEKKEAAYSLRDMGVVNGNHKRLDSAEQQLLRVIAILHSIGEKISPTTYNILGDFYRFSGQYDKALLYALEGLKATDEKDSQRKAFGHIVLGEIYDRIADYSNSLKHFHQAFELLDSRNDAEKFVIANLIANVMAAAGEPEKALNYFSSYLQKYKVERLNEQQQIAGTYGYIYSEMRDNARAEKYYLQMLSLNKAVQEENGRYRLPLNSTLAGGKAFSIIGKFYIERGRYAEGRQYISKGMESAAYTDTRQEMENYHLLFVADSAVGNYLSAIRNLERYNTISDSMNSVQKNKRVNELNIAFQTEQRLKEIEVLKNKEISQQAALQKAAITRNIIFAGAVGLLLLAAVSFKAYRNKQRSNRQLEQQREEIDRQNQELQNLLPQKDQLIREKEWLLKEVHHRVKNNLQIVMSLLSTQSSYLQSKDAIDAIMESENRVKSIALIHQKLYSSDNLSTINIRDYVSDLLRHLSASFNAAGRNIKFVQSIDNVNVDLSQAVPIGLILNEAITNSIKYAFDRPGGDIHVNFSQAGETALLSITDNGKGLPSDFDIRRSNSLGMQMMQGLAKQLKGRLDITNDAGTAIQVTFRLIGTTWDDSNGDTHTVIENDQTG